MPSIATHPQAKFDPIPPNLDLEGLVDRTPNFEYVQRIPASKIRKLEFEKLVWYQVIKQGKPLVIEGWSSKLPKSLFSSQWLEATYDKKQEDVRDINSQSNIPMTMGHYLRSMRQLTDQWTPNNFQDERRQRLYLKDIDCPPEWHDHLRKVMPPGLFYFNENVEDHGLRDDDLFMEEHTAAPAGDLMSSLPAEMRAQNLMCYIGHEGTYTPAHREMCGSLGQNIMVEASGNENGEKEGSSIWFMTETKDRQVAREYFLSMLGHDVEIEKHFAQINAWKKATFPVYIVEQRPGDFILIPPLAPHQVWNRGTRTMKVAWNRTTVETLDYALHEALPRARLVCRDEQYKNKAIIYYTLQKYYQQLRDVAESQMSLLLGDEVGRDSVRLIQLRKDFKKLLQLFTEILVDEMFASKEKSVEMIPFDSCVICSYCRSNIFNKFLTCKHCVRDLVDGGQDTYDVCMECYAMGRSCLCISGLSWCEQWDWSELVENYEAWRSMVILNDGYVDVNLSPPPLEVARMKTGRKALAQVCQEQLRRRPFNDISKPYNAPDPEPSEPEVNEEGRPKKPKRKKKKGDTYKCHTCCHQEYTYRLAFCSTPGCNQAYCFGVLYRAFDMMPQDVLQEEQWQCPRCQLICNCGGCRRTGITNPYAPKNTYIGHDTRAVADDRSQESLVDFRVHNLNWLNAAGDGSRNHNSKRIQRLRQEAEADKARDNADAAGDLAANDPASNQNDSAHQAVTDGLEDQREMTEAANGVSAQASDVPDHLQQPVNGAASGVDLSMLPDAQASLFPETEAYPDPSALGAERRLGMGYYEQDDTPDKILFNPYEEPTERDDPAGDFEESEWVKKSLRAAKRRARNEDEQDPDFVVGRSHKRKKTKADAETPRDAAQNLDPALVGEDTIMHNAASEEIEPQEAPTDTDDPFAEQDEQDGVTVDRGRPFDPNVPTLRHSRPKISYADNGDIEEFNDIVQAKPKKQMPKSTPVPDEVSRDPIDLAAEAMRAITGQQATPGPVSAPTRKRGPGRPRRSDTGPVRSPQATTKPTTPQTAPPKRRGRPPRSSLAINAVAIDNESETPTDSAIDELEEQLAKELEGGTNGASATPPVSAPKRRGRPPKKAVEGAEKPERARATRSAGSPATDTGPPSEKFMSMAERMALRGKQVKIGKKRSSRVPAGAATSTNGGARQASLTADPPSPAEEPPQSDDAPMQHAEPGGGAGKYISSGPASASPQPVGGGNEYISSGPASVASESKDASVAPRSRLPSAMSSVSRDPSRAPAEPARETVESTPPRLPPKPAGPTIVRLGDSEDEEESGGPTI
ncbi:hypothetical protein diail_3491, partial [Diaporthe ilicicola]